MIQKKLPTISIILPTFNSSRTLGKCLKSIEKQDYPKKLIEIIVVDGGSADKTTEIARKYTSKIIKVPQALQNAEYNKGIGVNKAKNDLLLMIDHDNILPHKLWLRNAVRPFQDSNKIVSVEPLRFHYDKKMCLMDRYFALIGGTDPVAFYLGKNSHLSYIYDKYNLYGKSIDEGDYYSVKFKSSEIPTIGGNGALVRKDLILRHSKSDPKNYFHIDVHVDLIKKGFVDYAITKDSITHLTHSSFFPFLKRRKYFVEKYYYEDISKRRYSVFDLKKDKNKLGLYILISITLVKPIYDSLRGFIKIHDIAWFVHPFMCICMLFAYGIPVIKNKIYKK